ncbi:hypothetical protein ACWCYZ_39595 [Streptomyces virginiae]
MANKDVPKCQHNKWCGLKLSHQSTECRKYAPWKMGSKGTVIKNRELWLKLSDLMENNRSIKVTDEVASVARDYPVTLTEYGLLDWYAMMSHRDKKAKRGETIKRPDYDVEPVELSTAQIAKAVGLGRNRLATALQCLSAMNLIIHMSSGHRGHPYYALSPHMGYIKGNAEVHSKLLEKYPPPIFDNVTIVDGESRPADYKWGPLSGGYE